MLADDFLRRVTLEALGAGVSGGHTPVRIKHLDGIVRHRLDQAAITVVARNVPRCADNGHAA
jgi:hypothetical protein